MNSQPIGFFDSGLGGLSVLKAALKLLPNENYIFYGDSANAPYGTKDQAFIMKRCIAICDQLTAMKCKAIVVACNTATSVAINELRSKYPIPIIGMEPALKVATDSGNNQNIAVLATPLTLAEKKFAALLAHHGGNNNIYKLACPELVKIVENNQLSNKQLIKQTFDNYFKDINVDTLDSMVLGCTHFVFFRDYLSQTYPNVELIDGNTGTCLHLKDILTTSNALNNQSGTVKLLNSDTSKLTLSKQLLGESYVD